MLYINNYVQANDMVSLTKLLKLLITIRTVANVAKYVPRFVTYLLLSYFYISFY